MSRYLSILVAVCLAVTGFAGVAQGGVKRHYSHAYHSAAQRCGGKDAVGRNVRREGDTLSNGKRVTKAKYKVLTAKLDGMCRPQPAVASTATTQAPGKVVAAPSTGGGACNAIPRYIVQRESGGDPGARNPSGAFGCYQLMPEHFEGGGACSDLGTDQAGQDECASRLWDGGNGSSNWAQTR